MPHDDAWDHDEIDAGLDFLEHFAPAEDVAPDRTEVDEVLSPGDKQDRADPDVSFTVSNPAGALSVTAALGGRLGYIEVKDVSRFDEAGLGQEIVQIAALAHGKARAAQHEVTVELMRRRGHDRVGVSALLEHSIGLPSYETSSARAAEFFAERYRSDDD